MLASQLHNAEGFEHVFIKVGMNVHWYLVFHFRFG